MDGGIPLATYRQQLTSGFTFDDAAAIARYLKKTRHQRISVPHRS